MDDVGESAILGGAMLSHDRPAPPDYGIMFNHDGTFLGKSEYPQRVDELLDKIYGPLQNTQVGAFMWCVGAEQARWPSENIESVVDPRERPVRFRQGVPKGRERPRYVSTAARTCTETSYGADTI